MNRLRFVVVAALVLLGVSGTMAAPDPSPVIVIQNATILTVTKGTIEHGSILIKDGKIAEVGPSVKAPKEATVIDAQGKFVTPGIIDCHSHIAIEGGVNEGSISVSSIANIAEVIDSDDVDIYRDLAGGVTTASSSSCAGDSLPLSCRSRARSRESSLRWGKIRSVRTSAFPGSPDVIPPPEWA